MGKFDKLKVAVRGGSNEVVKKPQQPTERTVSVNLKDNTVKTIKSKDERELIDLFNNIKSTIKSSKLDYNSAANLINLELKRVYIECTSDEHFDAETNAYLDSLLFNSIHEIIIQILSSNKTDKKIVAEIIMRSIENSVKLLDYHDTFKYDAMNFAVNEMLECFG